MPKVSQAHRDAGRQEILEAALACCSEQQPPPACIRNQVCRLSRLPASCLISLIAAMAIRMALKAAA